MSARAVVAYDLSGFTGYAIYSPDLDQPVFGRLTLPPTSMEGSGGPAFKLLYDHICWVQRYYPLAAIGYEQFIAPTGGKKDDETPFTTSPAALKKQIGLIAIVEMAAAILKLHPHALHNASWRKYWLGSQKRGTDRAMWKQLSIAKAKGLGWDVKTDDEADALGQLHFLLHKLGIRPGYGRNPSRELIDLGMMKGVPVGV